MPPATSRPLTPDSPLLTPCHALPCHASWCIQANAVPHTRCIILCLSFLSAPSLLSLCTLFPLYLILFFSHSQVSLEHAFRLSSCHAHRIFSCFFFGLLVLNYPSTLSTYTHSTSKMRGCVAIIVANVANEHFYLLHLGVPIMSTVSRVWNRALYLLSV